MLGRTRRSGRLGWPAYDVALDCHAVGLLDGSQAGGYTCFAGGDGLAVGPAVEAFEQGLAEALDLVEVGFSLVDVGRLQRT